MTEGNKDTEVLAEKMETVENVEKVEENAEPMDQNETPSADETDANKTEEPKTENESESVDAPFSLEELFAKHGGDPNKLDLSRSLLVSNLPSDFLADEYEVFQEAISEMVNSDFKVPREQIETVIRVPKLQADAADQANALSALISFKSKVHKHRVVAQKKVDDSSAMNLSSLEEIPKDWFEVDVLEMADEVGEEESEADKKKEDDKPKELTKEEIEAEKKREQEEREAFRKRYIEDDDDNVEFTIDWDGAPEFQWKICPQKNDQRKLILENVLPCDLRNPFLYRAILRAEEVDINLPSRYNSDGTKQHKGKIVLTYAYDSSVMPSAMRSLIYVRSANKRRIKVYLPQTANAMKYKEKFEERLGRSIACTLAMKQLVVKILPADFEMTIEKAIEWFPGTNIESAETVKDGRDQPCALITFATVTECMDAHASHGFIDIGETKCHVFMASIEVNQFFLSRFDKDQEKIIFRERLQKKNEANKAAKAEKEKENNKRKADDKRDDKDKKKPRHDIKSNSTSKNAKQSPGSKASAPNRGSVRGARGGHDNRPPRGSGAARGGGRGGFRGGASRGGPTPSARSVGRGPIGSGGPTRFNGPAFDSSFDLEKKIRVQREQLELREQLIKQQQMIDSLSTRLHRDPQPLSRSAFNLDRGYGGNYSSAGYGSSSAFGGDSAFGGNSNAFGSDRHSSGNSYNSNAFGSSSSRYDSPKRRSYGY